MPEITKFSLLDFIKNHAYDLLFGVLIAFVIFDFKISNLVLGLLFVYFFADYKSLKSLPFSKLKHPLFFILLIFVLYVYAHGLVFGVMGEKRYSLFALMPGVLLLSLKIKKIELIYLFFIFSAMGVTFFGCFNMILSYLETGKLILTSGEEVNQILHLERPYLGFVSIVSILLVFYFSQKYTSYKWLCYGLILFFTFYILLISARLSTLSLSIIFITYFLFYIKIHFVKKIGIILAFSSVFVGAVFLNKNLSERLVINQNVNLFSEEIKNHEPRVIIWNCAWGIANEKDFDQIFGLKSTELLYNKLTDCYSQDQGNDHRRAYFVKSRFNTHNQFLDIYITTGIIGFCALLVIFIVGFSLSYRQFIPTAFLLALFLFFVVENMLYRQMGVYLVGLIWSMILMFISKIKIFNSNP